MHYCIHMKHKFIILLVTITLSIVSFQGCMDQNNSKSILVTAPLNTLGLEPNDLPENIFPIEERYNDTEQIDIFDENITKLEEYTVDYRYTENDSFYVLLELRKIVSIEDTIKAFEAQKSVLIEYYGSIMEEIPIEEIGDESIMVKVGTRYHLILRIYNVILTITTAVDIEITEQDIINYVTIITNNIESSIKS